jgi:hypothetical protein
MTYPAEGKYAGWPIGIDPPDGAAGRDCSVYTPAGKPTANVETGGVIDDCGRFAFRAERELPREFG